MRNRGIGRGRLFVGGFLLFAAAIVWMVGLLMSPHAPGAAGASDQVRDAVVVYLRNSALATIGLAAFSAFLLFPARRPRWPARDWTLALLIALLALTSFYQLFWLASVVG